MSTRAKLNTIRIIGGQWRGRRLRVPDAEGLRPTIDRVRETLFNWLMHDLAGARCLDLFAGTGALGLECLSRGAGFVQFVESNQKAAEALQDNLRTLKVDKNKSLVIKQAQGCITKRAQGCITKQAQGCITKQDAMQFLETPPADSYDIVFLDPPFQSDLLVRSLDLLVKHHWLSDNAMIYLELGAKQPIPNIPEGWTLHRQGAAGQSAYYLYIS